MRVLFGLVPVACFLGALVALDSYKLVSLKRVLAVLVAGAAMAGVAYEINATLLETTDIGFVAFTRYVAPPVEEALKAARGLWLGAGFDADTEMLELINSGRLSDSPVGRYLHQLKDRFRGPIVADLLCYLRLHTELALRAKGILMMRENGFNPPIDEA